MKFLVAVCFSLPLIGVIVTTELRNIWFYAECTGHLKRAADANTVELAKEELATAITYLKNHNITSGKTGVFWNSTYTDIDFFYKNMTASLQELETVSPTATQLEKSNLLIKLRETLLDHGQHESITLPYGLYLYPFNTVVTVWSIIGILLMIPASINFVAGCTQLCCRVHPTFWT